jgi:DNA polymerase IV (DinB-like DNA polymerase)
MHLGQLRLQSLEHRVIMLVDLDYFFAQIEEVRNPSIEGKPVVVCVYSGRSEDSGAVSTANYVARRLGVKSGMPIALAKEKLQNVEAVFLPVDDAFYEEISERIMVLLRGYADSFEHVGIDEAFLDVTRRVKRSFEEAVELGQAIKKAIVVQHNLTCSIGIGPNKVVAKMAADILKPDGLTSINPEQVADFLSPLPIDHLIGVGAKAKERMQALRINTIGDLARYDVQKLIEVFGKKLGLYFHNASVGVDDEPVQERGEAESISRISTLKKDTRDLNLILEKTNELCRAIHADLLRSRLSFRTVGIVTVMKDMSIRSRSRSFDNATNNLEVLKDTVRELFEKFFGESNLQIRRVGVRVSSFAKNQKSQRQLINFIQ